MTAPLDDRIDSCTDRLIAMVTGWLSLDGAPPAPDSAATAAMVALGVDPGDDVDLALMCASKVCSLLLMTLSSTSGVPADEIWQTYALAVAEA